MVTIHSEFGYEPNPVPDLSAIAESTGVEPNTRRYISLSRRTISPSMITFLLVLMAGIEPTTSDVSGRRSDQLSYMSKWRIRKGSNLRPSS